MGKRALRKDRQRGHERAAAVQDGARRAPGRPVGATADRTRERILAGALEAFAEHGFAGCSIRDLARQARIRSATLYHYFPSKEALYTEVLRTMQDEMRGVVFSVFGGEQDLRVAGREIVGRMFDFFLAHPAYVRFGLHIRLDGMPAFDQRTTDRWLGFVEALTKPTEAGLKTFDPMLLIATVDGLIQWHIANDGFYRTVAGKGLDDPSMARRIREHIIDIVMRMVGLE